MDHPSCWCACCPTFYMSIMACRPAPSHAVGGCVGQFRELCELRVTIISVRRIFGQLSHWSYTHILGLQSIGRPQDAMPTCCAVSGSCTATAITGMSAPPAMLVKCSLQTSKIAAAFIAALLLLVIFWSRKLFTVIMCLIFVAAIIACYFIPNPAGGEIMRYFVLFVGYAPLLALHCSMGDGQSA